MTNNQDRINTIASLNLAIKQEQTGTVQRAAMEAARLTLADSLEEIQDLRSKLEYIETVLNMSPSAIDDAQLGWN